MCEPTVTLESSFVAPELSSQSKQYYGDYGDKPEFPEGLPTFTFGGRKVEVYRAQSDVNTVKHAEVVMMLVRTA